MTQAHHAHHPHEGKAHGHSDKQEDLSIAEQIEQKFQNIRDEYEKIHDKVGDVSDSLSKKTRKNPLLALGVAVACGMLIGKILK